MAFEHDDNPITRCVGYPMQQPTSNTMPTTGEDDVIADVDEPPDHRVPRREAASDFHRSTVLLQGIRQESLLTKALHTIPADTAEPESGIAMEMSRRRSTMSTNSAASTADLTSDEGITSPARTNTPSPPPTTSTYLNLASYVLGRKSTEATALSVVQQDPGESMVAQLDARDVRPQPDPAVEALVKKRCITFACGGQKPKLPAQQAPRSNSPPAHAQATKTDTNAPKRTTIKFACPGPKAAESPQQVKDKPTVEAAKLDPLPKDPPHRHNSRSPSMHRKFRSTPPGNMKIHQDSISTVRRTSQSPIAFKTRRPTYIVADEDALRSSEATRFHEFASDEPQEDDWIRKDVSDSKQKLTINDTLKKENAIRQLGKEVEEEALQDDEEDGEDEVAEDSDDENEDDEDDEDDEENVDEDGQDDQTIDGSDDDSSDGNETDNEAGFADSDDESDVAGDFQFWTPGRSILDSNGADVNTFRATTHIAASESSIDSLKHKSLDAKTSSRPKKARASRRIKIRPGTPDLPDSTDFVCGTLDEDRPLEYAYVSCMEARKREKHHLIPQDIDPSFPTSDPEDRDEDNDVKADHDSEENIWLHGKFEDSEEDQTQRRRYSTRKMPALSPKRLHSPPPPKQRLRSPPPRRLFGHSPQRLRSPPPARHIRSPAASPATHAVAGAITFAALGHRPGLTHTKSLPRTPNVFCHQYRAARLAAANDESEDATSGHTRGAIDIVKGLEHKRQRRKEKLYQKLCNRARKGQPQKKPQPGKGAERMRDLGLQLAGKVEERTGQAAYVISL